MANNDAQPDSATETDVTWKYLFNYYRYYLSPFFLVPLLGMLIMSILKPNFVMLGISCPLLFGYLYFLKNMSHWTLTKNGIKIKSTSLIPWNQITRSFHIPLLNIFVLFVDGNDNLKKGIQFTVSHPKLTYELWDELRKKAP